MIEQIGLGDGDGHLSFNKTVTLVALAVFVFAVVTRRDPAWPLLSFGVIVIGAGFGLKGFLAAVKQNSIEAQFTNAVAVSASLNTSLTGDLAKIAEIVTTRRDAKRGVEAAP